MSPEDGLRVINSADQIAQFEFASIRTSESVLAVVRQVREGVAETELEEFLIDDLMSVGLRPDQLIRVRIRAGGEQHATQRRKTKSMTRVRTLRRKKPLDRTGHAHTANLRSFSLATC